MRPTRIDFVWALPAILGLYNHSERVQGTNPQRTFFCEPIQPENFFFQKIPNFSFLQNHPKNSIFERDFAFGKKWSPGILPLVKNGHLAFCQWSKMVTCRFATGQKWSPGVLPMVKYADVRFLLCFSSPN